MQARVAATLTQQVIVTSHFHYASLFQRHDAVALANGGQPVSDDENGAASRHGPKVSLDDLFE